MASILVVEDDALLASSLRRALGYEGYQVDTVGDGTTALSRLRSQPPDLVLLDVMLPGLDGIEICRRIRQMRSDLPVLMLTARDGVADRVHGLDAGADDYLVKPFANEELKARIRSLLRRGRTEPAQLLTCDDLELDPNGHAVRRQSGAIDLTAQEFRLLHHFLLHRGQVLSRGQLLDAVWGLETDTTSNVVDVYVRYLRQKLEAEGAQRLIHTVRGVGYVLRAP